MSRYIYQSPKECSRALQLIAEQMDPETESANALYTAIGYLTSMQIESVMRCDCSGYRVGCVCAEMYCERREVKNE